MLSEGFQGGARRPLGLIEDLRVLTEADAGTLLHLRVFVWVLVMLAGESVIHFIHKILIIILRAQYLPHRVVMPDVRRLEIQLEILLILLALRYARPLERPDVALALCLLWRVLSIWLS